MDIATDDPGTNLDADIRSMASLPEEEQDWDEIYEKLKELTEEREFPESRVKLLEARVMMLRKRYDDAKNLIREAVTLAEDGKEQLDAYYAAIALLLNDPESGPEKALERVNVIEQKFGDSPRVRITRAGITKAINPPDAVAQLEALADGIGEWSDHDQAQVQAAIALQLEQLGHRRLSVKYWEKSTEASPNSLPVYMHIFDTAFRNRDFEGMLEAEQKVLDMVGSEDDASYILCHVKRKLLEFTTQKIDREEFAPVIGLLDKALEARSQWAELHVLYGQVLVVLEEDIDEALRHLDLALQFGPRNANALGLQVRILAQRGNYDEAYAKLQMIPVELRPSTLGRAEADVLLRAGYPQEAFESAKNLAEAEDDSAATLGWFADFASQVDQLDEAAKALEKATALRGSDADLWLKLIGTYAQQKNEQGIQDALRTAQLQIEADVLPMFTAKRYELVGDWQSAEKIYVGTFGDRLDELPVARRMAEFYELWGKAGKVDPARSNVYLNRILKSAYDGTVSRTHPVVSWAIEKAVTKLSSARDYQDFLKAEKILNPTGDWNQLSMSQRGLLARIYSERPEPTSQLKAMELLSDMHKKRQISKDGILQLAKLLSRADRWEQGEQLLIDSLAAYNEDEQIRATYIDLLIERGDYRAANAVISNLRSDNPRSRFVMPMSLKLAGRSGDQTEVTKILSSLTPSLRGSLSKEDLGKLLNVARLAFEYDQIDRAGALYQTYLERDMSALPEYTRFVARHGDPAQAVKLIERQFPQLELSMLRISTAMLRERYAEIGDEFNDEIEALIQRALRKDPESIALLMIDAEFYEITGDYERAINKYDKILARDDLDRTSRAAAMNNLGFLLGLVGERLDEADQLITQAIEIYGPISDILDTRAVVRMVNKNYEGAVEDMKLATAFEADPVKYYHLARANMLAGDSKAALEAWESATELGIEKGKVPTAEQEEYDGVQNQIEALRTQSAGL